MDKYVTYYRVSTVGQEQTGLGIEAQRSAVLNYAKGGTIIAEFTETESGKKNRRPELLKALELTKKENATLLIAKLDRLSRNVSFIFSLKDAGINFIACDMPDANTMTIGIMAVMAQQERELISVRTKAALTELKKKGVKLGNPEAFRDKTTQEQAYKKSLETRQGNARSNQNNLRAYTLIKAQLKNGLNFAQIADELNKGGFKTARGGKFQIIQVQRIIKLYEE